MHGSCGAGSMHSNIKSSGHCAHPWVGADLVKRLIDMAWTLNARCTGQPGADTARLMCTVGVGPLAQPSPLWLLANPRGRLVQVGRGGGHAPVTMAVHRLRRGRSPRRMFSSTVSAMSSALCPVAILAACSKGAPASAHVTGWTASAPACGQLPRSACTATFEHSPYQPT